MGDTHHCIICGKGYKFCDSCRNARGYTPWRVIADAPECYQIHLLIAVCRQGGASEDDYNNLKRLSETVNMKEEVADVIGQLLENHK